MDRESAQTWLDHYLAAWKSYDREEIAALFAPTVEYRYHPHDEPIVGIEAVVASWLDEVDDAGTYDARYTPYAVDGDRVVATGISVGCWPRLDSRCCGWCGWRSDRCS